MSESLAKIERPKRVTFAIRILWVSLVVGTAISILRFTLDWDYFVSSLHLQEEKRAVALIIAEIVVLGGLLLGATISIFLYVMIAKGRNWARIVLLVFNVIGLPFWFFSNFKHFSVSAEGVQFELDGMLSAWSQIAFATGIITCIAAGVALYLLFTKPGSDWFRHKRDA